MRKNALRSVAAFVLALGLGACSQDLTQLHSASNLSDFVAALQKITVGDLEAATARAIAGGDVMGAQCYPVLEKYVSQGLPGVEKLAGAFDAFEAARLGRKNFSAGVPDDLRMACAPLMMDEREFVLKMVAIAGAGAATSGAAPLIIGPAVPLLR